MNSLASIIIVTYNHKRYLDSCLKSIQKQDYPYEIIIVDNSSNDCTSAFIETNFPNVRLIKNSKNFGYGRGNNIGVKHANGKFIVILNPDTIVNETWLKELITPLKINKNLITTPKILLYNGSAINTCGNINHFTGLSFTRGLNQPPSNLQIKQFLSGFSGCNFAIRKDNYKKLAGFDANFFSYLDDSELSWRAHLKGYKILYVPTSIIKHDYILKVTPEKIYHLEKGRYIILRKYFSWKEFLLSFPSLLIAEFLTIGFSVKLGWKGIKSKIKAIRDGLIVSLNKEIGNKKLLFNSLCDTIPPDQLTFNALEKALKVISNHIFKLNFKVLKQK